MFSIGMVSEKVGVKVPTIRYYEQMGLMSEPSRTAGNQRRYSQSQVERLAFIKHARQLGFSLEVIASLIDLSQSEGENCAEIDQLATAHLAQVRNRIELLRTLESELCRIVAGCASGHHDQCYVIESLARHELCLGDHASPQH